MTALAGRTIRRRRLGWVAATAVLAAALAAVWVLSGAPEQADPGECAALATAAVELQDITIVHEMQRRGCDDPPYDAINWP